MTDHPPSKNLLAWLAFDAADGALELIHDQLRAQQWAEDTFLDSTERNNLLHYLNVIRDGQALPTDVQKAWRTLVCEGMHVVVALQAARDIHAPAKR